MKSDNISRRKFMKNLGTGVLTTGAVMHTFPGSTLAGEQSKSDDSAKNKMALALKVNGKKVKLHIEPQMTLAELLREKLNLTGTKVVCNHGECGACTALLDGKAVYSCHMLAMDAANSEVITIEGLLDGEKLHPVQQAFVDEDGFQCGFCTPGQIMAAYALLLKNPKPTRADVMRDMSGNLCRCAAYPKIADSVMAAAEKMK